MAGVPVEAITDRYRVSYVPSASVWAHLAEIHRPLRPAPLLAVADPRFRPPEKSPTPAAAAPKEEQDFAALLASTTRGPVPGPVPGSKREALALAGLLAEDQARVLLGSRARKPELDTLAKDDRLRDYRLLHFATHGQMNKGSASLSALLLSPDEQTDPGAFAGRLTVADVRKWKLDADLVTLSACDTGLGKDRGGEGFLGFTQALLQAGARAVVLSRWKVDDTATALLMVRFYENLMGKRPGLKAPLGRAEALREAQHWLRDLPRAQADALAAKLGSGELRGPVTDLGKVVAEPQADPKEAERPYPHPYYWSAFLLLGDPD
jgi:CHAT domain-containing protein